MCASERRFVWVARAREPKKSADPLGQRRVTAVSGLSRGLSRQSNESRESSESSESSKSSESSSGSNSE